MWNIEHHAGPRLYLTLASHSLRRPQMSIRFGEDGYLKFGRFLNLGVMFQC